MINAKLLQLVVDASNDGIVVAEQEGDDFLRLSDYPDFQRLTRYVADDQANQHIVFLQAGDREQIGLELIRQAVHEHRPCRQVIRNYRKDGSLFWNELSITPVFNEADQLTYYIGIQKDVTEQVEAQQRVVELEAELAALKAELAALKAKPQG